MQRNESTYLLYWEPTSASQKGSRVLRSEEYFIIFYLWFIMCSMIVVLIYFLLHICFFLVVIWFNLNHYGIIHKVNKVSVIFFIDISQYFSQYLYIRIWTLKCFFFFLFYAETLTRCIRFLQRGFCNVSNIYYFCYMLF